MLDILRLAGYAHFFLDISCLYVMNEKWMIVFVVVKKNNTIEHRESAYHIMSKQLMHIDDTKFILGRLSLFTSKVTAAHPLQNWTIRYLKG